MTVSMACLTVRRLANTQPVSTVIKLSNVGAVSELSVDDLRKSVREVLRLPDSLEDVPSYRILRYTPSRSYPQGHFTS